MIDVRKTPKHLRRLNAALGLREVPDYEAALDQLLKAQEEAPRDVDVLLALGLTYQDLDHSAEAEDSLRTALGLAPDDEAVRAALAGLLASRARFKEVEKLLEPVIERRTSNPDVWYYYAMSVLDRDPEGGLTELSHQLEITFVGQRPSEDVSERIWQARVTNATASLGRDELLEIIEAGLDEFPDSLPLRKEQARALVDLGRFEEAVSVMKRLRAEGLPEFELRYEETMARLEAGQSYRSVLPTPYTFSQGVDLSDIAGLLLRRGRLQEATMAAEDAFAIETHLYEQSALELAQILAHGGKPEDAGKIVTRVLAGDFSHEDGDFEYFLVDIGGAVALDIVLAHIALVQGQFQEAIQHFEKAEAHPDADQPFWFQPPVVCCCHQRRLMGPLPQPSNADAGLRAIRANLATAYCLNGDMDKALASAIAAVETPAAPEADFFGDEDKYTAYAVLGCVHLARGETEQARQAWREGLALIGDTPDMQQAAALLQQWLQALDQAPSEDDK